MLTKTDLQEMLLLVEALLHRIERKQDLGASWVAYLEARRRRLTLLIANWSN